MQSLRKEVELRQSRQHQERNRDHSQGLVVDAARELWRRLKPTLLEGKGKRAGKMPALQGKSDGKNR
jgi:hypothetical protein